MGQEDEGSALTTADKWLLVGNLLSVAGCCAVGVGTVYKLAQGPGLPAGRPVFTNPSGADTSPPQQPQRNAARDYFGL